MGKISLSDGEWKLMNLLWQEPPKTIMQLTRELEPGTGWSKNIVITMLKRLEVKGAVRHEVAAEDAAGHGQGGVIRRGRASKPAKQFYPAIDREEAVLEETKGFLERIYQGSLSLLVCAMVDSKKLSSEDIAELQAILKKAEEEQDD